MPKSELARLSNGRLLFGLFRSSKSGLVVGEFRKNVSLNVTACALIMPKSPSAAFCEISAKNASEYVSPFGLKYLLNF